MRRICRVCHIDKELLLFPKYVTSRNKKLRRLVCKKCYSKMNTLYRKTRPEHFLKYARRWRFENKDRIIIYSLRNYKKNYSKILSYNRKKPKIVQSAYNKIKYSIKLGIIKKQPCGICHSPNSQAHHEDYSKPLDVIWLCARHHRDRHMENKFETV